MYEHRHQPLLPKHAFRLRVLKNLAFAMGIIALALGIGVAGYHGLEKMPWIDSLLNASMILGGMGPVGELHTHAGKLFASGYALFSGLLLITVAGVLFAPVIHRFLHKFHLDSDREKQREK